MKTNERTYNMAMAKQTVYKRRELKKKTEWQKVSRPIETAFQKLLIIGHEIATIYYQ